MRNLLEKQIWISSVDLFPQDMEIIQEFRGYAMESRARHPFALVWGAKNDRSFGHTVLIYNTFSLVAHRLHSDKVSLDFSIATAVELNGSKRQKVSQCEWDRERKWATKG